MTDLLIEKAIECCIEGRTDEGKIIMPDCKHCPYFEDEDCCSTLSSDIRDYVKRKKTELTKIAMVGKTVYLSNYNDWGDIARYKIEVVGIDRDGWFFILDDEETSKVYFDDTDIVGVEVFFDHKSAKEYIEKHTKTQHVDLTNK